MSQFRYEEMLPIHILEEIAGEMAASYSTALPFSHGVYDNVFSPALLDQVIAEFDNVNSGWTEFDTKYEKKLQMSADKNLGDTTRQFIHNLNSAPFLNFLQRLTGIEGLISDPYLEGAGLHKIEKGGKLGIHVDFDEHETMKLNRRLNVLIYLNKDWRASWGGAFELWDPITKQCAKKVLPVYNRMVVFSTTSKSFHGHPEPLNCPPDRYRLSLALYYYTVAKAESSITPGHGTLFLNRRGETEELKPNLSLVARIKNKCKAVIS